MAILHFEPVPPRQNKADLIRLLCEVGGLDKKKIGRIDLRGNRATAEVPDSWEARLVRTLDGSPWGERHVRVWSDRGTGPVSSDDHFARMRRLLALESQAELERAAEMRDRLSPSDAERSGRALVDLVVDDEDSGLGGRYILSLVKRNRTLSMPWHRLNVGAPVILSQSGDGAQQQVRGVVCERNERRLRVVLNAEVDDADAGSWRVDLASDEIAAERQRAALTRAAGAGGERLADLRRVLLGERPPRFQEELPDLDFERTLNESQQEAIRFALSAQDVALIHGPPGTGKTTTVVELICQAVRRGDKVLACAPSNLAVDNMLEKLVSRRVRAVRIGHPARVLESLREHTLDYLVEEHRDVQLARKLVKEARALFRQASRYTRARPEPGARQELRQDAKRRLADARQMEAAAVKDILDRANVICATTTGLDSELLGQRHFGLVVLDEACQSTEPGCWPPLLRAERVVLAGDHCQLPPTVVSPQAVAEGFEISLFERLMNMMGPQISRRLTTQYRMHQAIMDFSSLEFYDAELVADPSVEKHLLTDLPGIEPSVLTQAPIEFIDTAGAGYEEEAEPDGESRLNPQEAALVARKVEALVAAGVAASDIAVIAPYAAQVRLLRTKLDLPGLEIDSVDGFQGREKEAVVISLVRSNPAGEIGFLSEIRRTNVAMTRARRKLLLIGDSATLSSHPFYSLLLEYIEQVGGYRTVWEEAE